MKKPYKSNIEYYNLQSLNIFNKNKFYHRAFIGETEEEFINYIIQEAEITPLSSVLDMGCGSGYLVNELSEFCEAEGIKNSTGNLKVCESLYPDNKFTLADMETYECELKSHVLALESFNYSNPEKTFKRAYNNLQPGGILFIKEWCGVEDDNGQTLQNKNALEDIFYYNPYKLSYLLRIAEEEGFELIRKKNLERVMNQVPYKKSLEDHHEYVKKAVFPTLDPNTRFVIPYQLKFKKNE